MSSIADTIKGGKGVLVLIVETGMALHRHLDTSDFAKHKIEYTMAMTSLSACTNIPLHTCNTHEHVFECSRNLRD